MANKYTKTFVCDKDTLKKLYFEEGMTQTEIAKKFDTSQKIIWRMMRDFGLKARIPKKRYQQGKNNDNWSYKRYIKPRS